MEYELYLKQENNRDTCKSDHKLKNAIRINDDSFIRKIKKYKNKNNVKLDPQKQKGCMKYM